MIENLVMCHKTTPPKKNPLFSATPFWFLAVLLAVTGNGHSPYKGITRCLYAQQSSLQSTHPSSWQPGFGSHLGHACEDLFLGLQCWRLHAYLSSLTRPCKWRFHLTNFEQESKRLRTIEGNKLAGSDHSVSLISARILHIHAGNQGKVVIACDFGSRDPGYGSRMLRCDTVPLGKALHLYVHSFDPGVNQYLVGPSTL